METPLSPAELITRAEKALVDAPDQTVSGIVTFYRRNFKLTVPQRRRLIAFLDVQSLKESSNVSK